MRTFDPCGQRFYADMAEMVNALPRYGSGRETGPEVRALLSALARRIGREEMHRF